MRREKRIQALWVLKVFIGMISADVAICKCGEYEHVIYRGAGALYEVNEVGAN